MKNIIKNKLYVFGVLSVFLLTFAGKVSALDVGVNANVKMEAGDDTSVSSNASATGTVKSQNATTVSGNATSSVKSGGSEGAEQRSSVAVFVQSLTSIAGRAGGIGSEVRLVAQEQASTSAKVEKDMDEVNSDSSLKVFLFGPDYKSLGSLRSSIVTTENNIARLEKAKENTTDAGVKADLDVQIKALENIKTSTQAFVDLHASKLSLLGWFVHIFVR